MEKARVWRQAWHLKVLLIASMTAALFAFFANAASAAPATSGTPCWKLVQVEKFAGRLVGYISDKAIKLETVFGTLIAMPDKVICCNERTKKYCEWKTEEFDKHSKLFTHRSLTYKWPMTEWKKVGVVKLAGVEADQYKRFNPELPAGRQFFEELWVHSKATSEPRLIRKFITYLRIPAFKLNRMPMQFRRTWVDDNAPTKKDQLEVQEELKTLSWGQVSVPANFFTPPKGLVKVKDEFDVMMGEGSDSNPLETLPPDLKKHFSDSLEAKKQKAK